MSILPILLSSQDSKVPPPRPKRVIMLTLIVAVIVGVIVGFAK